MCGEARERKIRSKGRLAFAAALPAAKRGSPKSRKVVTVGIKQYKPTSPGRRFQTVSDFAEITTSKPEKSLLAPKPKKAGRRCWTSSRIGSALFRWKSANGSVWIGLRTLTPRKLSYGLNP